MSDVSNMTKLEDSLLWKEACSLAEYMYGKLHEFPAEEKWESERKLRSAANDIMFYVAEAEGNAMVSSAEYDWNNARKHATSLKSTYRFAGRQKMIELDPEIMVRLSRFIEQIEAKFKLAANESEARNKKDLEAWREKYRTWKKVEELEV